MSLVRRPLDRGVGFTALIGFSGLVGLAAVAISTVSVPASAAQAVTSERSSLELPYPALVHLESPIQDQLRRERRLLDDAVAADSDGVELADKYGYVGQLYFLYDLIVPAEIAFGHALRLDPERSEWHYYRGVIHRFEGRPAESAEALRRARQLAPEDLPTLLRLGDVQLESAEYADAATLFVTALELAPDNAAALHGLGRARSGLGEHQAAVTAFSRALELQPSATSIHHGLGMAYRALGNREQARFHLERNAHGVVQFEDPLVTDLADLVAGGGAFLKLGNEAMRRGEVMAAAEQYRLAAEGNPGSALIRYNLGTAMLRMGDTAAAMREFEQALELDPDHRDAHYNLGATQFQNGRYREAEMHLRRAHEIDPEDRQAHLDWAVSLSRTGQSGPAATELSQLVASDPRYVDAVRNLGLALVGSGQIAAELERLDRVSAAASSDEDRASIAFQQATYYESAGRFAEALAAFERAVEWDALFQEAYKGMGRLYGRAGSMTEAQQAFRRALELGVDDAEALSLLAQSLLLEERYDDARILLRERLQERPDDIEVAHLLARLLATCPIDEIRNGERALRMAAAVFQTARTVEHGETVAMALAETGKFDQAIDFQQHVIELATQQGRQDVAALRRHLAQFEQGARIRAPWLER